MAFLFYAHGPDRTFLKRPYHHQKTRKHHQKREKKNPKYFSRLRAKNKSRRPPQKANSHGPAGAIKQEKFPLCACAGLGASFKPTTQARDTDGMARSNGRGQIARSPTDASQATLIVTCHPVL